MDVLTTNELYSHALIFIVCFTTKVQISNKQTKKAIYKDKSVERHGIWFSH